jgi:hypothetical protein
MLTDGAAMITRRRLMVFGLLATLTALGVGGWMLWPQPTAITRENAAKINIGMTVAQVEAILGGPERDDTTGPGIREEPPEFAPPDASGRRYRITFIDTRPRLEWRSDEVQIWVLVNSDACVTECTWFPMRRAPESPLDKLRRWLHL